ncbi:MAG: tetratricopeptide repeat protein [Bacteroidia bacterium]
MIKRIYTSGLILLITVLFCHCGSRQTGSTIAWSPETDSLLHDTLSLSRTIDSLKKEVLRAVSDTAAIDNLNKLALVWKGRANLVLSEDARTKSEELNYAYGKADAVCKMASAYIRQAKYAIGDSLLDLSLKEARLLKNDRLVAQALFWKSEVPRLQANNPRARMFLDSSLVIAKRINDKSREAYCLSGTGMTYFIDGDYKKALEFIHAALALDKSDKNHICICYNGIGEINRMQEKDKEALDYYKKALAIASEIKDKNRMAMTYTTMGELYRSEENYPLALEYHQKAIGLARELKDRNRYAFCLVGTGEIYRKQKQYEKAIPCYEECIAISREINNKINLGFSLNALGEVYYEIDNYERSVDCFREAIKVATEQNDQVRIGICLSSIANVHRLKSENDSAIIFFGKALKIGEEMKNINLLTFANYSLGKLYFNSGRTREANVCGEKALAYARTGSSPDNIQNAAHLLFTVYEKLGNAGKALEMHKLYTQMKDSVENNEQVKKFAAVEYQAKEEKLKAEQEGREKSFRAERAVKEEELKRQKLVRNGFIIGFVLLGLLVFIVYRSLQQNRKAKEEIQKQKELVEEKQKEILDSIYYARRIQRSLLTNEKYIDKRLGILNKPPKG